MSKISIIIPVYNGEKYLAEAINSVLNQKCSENVEVIVVNDGSSDRSGQIARQLGVTVIDKEHSGLAATRNYGIINSTGDYIALLDADDVMVNDSLQTLVNPLLENDQIFGVFGMAMDFISDDISDSAKKNLVPRKEKYSGLLTGICMFRRETFKIVGLFNDTLKTGEGMEWLLSLRDSHLQTIQLNQLTVRRRLHDANMGITLKQQEKQDYLNIIRQRVKRKQEGVNNGSNGTH